MKSLVNRNVRLELGLVVLSAFLSSRAYGSGASDFLQISTTSSQLSSSTSSPSKDDKSAFVDSRFAAIRYDAARGYGENLDTLATLLGEPDRAEFAHWMKAHFENLFVGLDRPSELLVRIEVLRGREG